jgi:hypothetical protein
MIPMNFSRRGALMRGVGFSIVVILNAFVLLLMSEKVYRASKSRVLKWLKDQSPGAIHDSITSSVSLMERFNAFKEKANEFAANQRGKMGNSKGTGYRS